MNVLGLRTALVWEFQDNLCYRGSFFFYFPLTPKVLGGFQRALHTGKIWPRCSVELIFVAVGFFLRKVEAFLLEKWPWLKNLWPDSNAPSTREGHEPCAISTWFWCLSALPGFSGCAFNEGVPIRPPLNFWKIRKPTSYSYFPKI